MLSGETVWDNIAKRLPVLIGEVEALLVDVAEATWMETAATLLSPLCHSVTSPPA